MKKLVLRFSFLYFLVVTILSAQEVDLQIVQRISREGLENSKVAELVSYLTDVYGPRLANSPEFFKGANWTVNKLKEMGFQNVALEPYGTFGRGWELKKFYAAMTEPQYMPLIAYPKAWTKGTNGLIKGQAVLLDVKKPEDLNQYKGKIKGAIVLTGGEQEIPLSFEPDAARRSDEDLKKLEMAPEPGARNPFFSRREEFRARRELMAAVSKFLNDEGAALTLEPSRGKDGTIFVQSGGSYRIGSEEPLPSVVVSTEQYNRLVRIMQKDIPVMLEVEIQSNYVDTDTTGYNIIAEIPGTDKKLKDEIVMLGGHFDTWHAGTGATDNGSGCAIAIEAMRILKAIGVQPKRTIRLALWNAEEEGLLGSRAYVKNHFFDLDTKEKKPEYDKLSVYFNYDNGSGKIRGIYAQSNNAVVPVFEEWLKPFNDLGASTVTIRNTGSTDHASFDAVGLPGFQFIQDELEYSTRTHHSNMDVYDNLSIPDLIQSATIMASFIYDAAMRDQKLPRKYFDPNEVRARRF